MGNIKPTMKDVAREAGVALGTVSKVINGSPVGDRYRVRVEQAVEKLGYQVNQYARCLKTNKTNVVAVILPGLEHPYFASLAHNLYSALSQRGYRMLLFLTSYELRQELECIRVVRQNKADGIIALSYNLVEPDDDIPFVSIDRYLNANVPCVSSDNYGGGRLAAEKLFSLGCSRPVFIRTGSPTPGEADKRGDGFDAACRLAQVPCDSLILNDGEDVDERFMQFFDEHSSGGSLNIDGVFCSTDHLAIRIKRLLARRGVGVPEDVQLIGFDGIRRFDDGRYYCSTIVQQVDKIAETSVELLLNPDRSSTPALVCLPVTFAPGGTTRE